MDGLAHVVEGRRALGLGVRAVLAELEGLEVGRRLGPVVLDAAHPPRLEARVDEVGRGARVGDDVAPEPDVVVEEAPARPAADSGQRLRHSVP